MPCFSQLLCPSPAYIPIIHHLPSSSIFLRDGRSRTLPNLQPSMKYWGYFHPPFTHKKTHRDWKRGKPRHCDTTRSKPEKTVWKTSWISLLAFICLGMQVVFLIAVLMISSLAVLSWEFLIALYAFWIRMAFLYFISFLVMSHPRPVNCSMLSLCPRNKP